MFNKTELKEIEESFVDAAQSLMDGNFAVIDQRYVVELLMVDDEISVLSFWDAGDFMYYEPTSLNGFNSKDIKRRYFSGGEENFECAAEAYYTLIRHRNIEEFLGMFDK